jgi:hypothetical protein
MISIAVGGVDHEDGYHARGEEFDVHGLLPPTAFTATRRSGCGVQAAISSPSASERACRRRLRARPAVFFERRAAQPRS